jgi:hypothetical protein
MARTKVAARSICTNCKQDMPVHQGLPKPNPDEVMALWLVQTAEYLDDQSILRGVHPGCPGRGTYSHDSHGEIIRRGPVNGS